MSFKLICSICNDDINAKNQDNMSHGFKPICEDCIRSQKNRNYNDNNNNCNGYEEERYNESNYFSSNDY